MKARIFIAIAALAACLWSCNIERVVDTVEGSWQLSDAKIIARTPLGENIEATSTKELLLGALKIAKAYFPEDTDLSEFEEQINEMEDTPFSFTQEDNAFRLQFSKDGTFRSLTKDKDGKWTASDTDGEYSYAGYRLVMYFANEDGTQSQVPATIVKLTNKHLTILVKLADMFSMPIGNPMATEGDDDDEGLEGMNISMLFNLIDLTTELNFNKV